MTAVAPGVKQGERCKKDTMTSRREVIEDAPPKSAVQDPLAVQAILAHRARSGAPAPPARAALT